MPVQPAVLLITGSWHVPEHYERLTTRLTAAGFHVACPRLLTANNTVPPPYGLDDDVAQIQQTAAALADAGHPILAIMHSYGGLVGTCALGPFSLAQRARDGKTGGVVHLLYMSAFLLPLHGRLVDPFGGDTPPVLRELDNGTLEPLDPRNAFYNDLPDEEKEQALGLMVGCPRSVLRAPVHDVAYEVIESTYLVCENDQAIPPAGQRAMAQLLAKEGKEPSIESCEGSHSPFWSVPDQVVDVVRRCWKATGLPMA